MPKVNLDNSGRVAEGPPPNPDIIKRDPMAEMFGPGSGVKLVGDIDDQMPDQVRALLEQYGLPKKSFQCVLKHIPEGSTIGDYGSSTNSKYIKGWARSVPSIEYIAQNYGPGMYLLQFMWRERSADTNGESKAMNEEVTIEISEKLAQEFRQRQLDRTIENASSVGRKVQEKLIEKSIEGKMISALTGKEGEPQNPAEIAKNYINQTLETVKMMGLPVGIQQPKGIDWEKILPVAVTAVTAFLTHQREVERARQEDFNKMLMLMMSQSQNANTQLLEIMKLQGGTGSGNQMIKEFGDMIRGAIDLKELMTPQQEGLADKIFKVVESIAPQILSIAASAAQAKSNPAVTMARGYIANNPDFQALQKDPTEMKSFIGKMDDFFGTRQTDTILTVAGWARPPECPRDPAKENPPDMNNAPAVDVTDGGPVEETGA